MQVHNQNLFDEVKQLALPRGQYAITSSGPLGIRGIREIGDVDIIVSSDLWEKLVEQYGSLEENGIKKVRISDNIEVLGEGSFFAPRSPDQPCIEDQIQTSETIDGLPFVDLRYILHFKKELNRPKDITDIELIEKILSSRD